ncbi:MAG: low temperature requirement protein A, partial [Mycobacterium sp.]|nr:low temperature requirement protein A [Mycobacterium sp.]
AAFSAGVEVAVAKRLHESHLPHTVAGLTLTIPLAVFVVATWLALDAVRRDAVQAAGTAVLALALLASALLPYPLPGAAAVMVAAVALVSWRHSAESR